MRKKQLRRWAIGHDQCFFDHFFETLKSPFLTFRQKVDGLLLLGVYVLPFLILIGWLTGILTYLAGSPWWISLFPAVLFIFSYSSFGNFAVFTEVGGSLFLDQRRRSIWLLPLILISFFANVWVCSRAFFEAILLRLQQRDEGKPTSLAEIQESGMTSYSYSNALDNFHGKTNNSHRWDKTRRSGNGLLHYNNAKNAEAKRNQRRS
jgi:cellulose synthase/poly-beta-1,6-N-acetylglucosamine synthase-like glycosyltransferase